MRKDEIRVGGQYVAKVAGTLTVVRVDEIRERDGSYFERATTRYEVTNVRTGRRTTFRSATKFRREYVATARPILDASTSTPSDAPTPAPQ
jgi:hypothetical protein